MARHEFHDRPSDPGDHLGTWLVTSPRDAPRLIPARRLAASVLLQAIADIDVRRAPVQGCGTTDPRTHREFSKAVSWFASDATDWPFAFRNLCEALDLDPANVRRAVGITSKRTAAR